MFCLKRLGRAWLKLMDSEADELLFPQVILSSMFQLEMYMRCTVSKRQSAKLSGREVERER